MLIPSSDETASSAEVQEIVTELKELFGVILEHLKYQVVKGTIALDSRSQDAGAQGVRCGDADY